MQTKQEKIITATSGQYKMLQTKLNILRQILVQNTNHYEKFIHQKTDHYEAVILKWKEKFLQCRKEVTNQTLLPFLAGPRHLPPPPRLFEDQCNWKTVEEQIWNGKCCSTYILRPLFTNGRLLWYSDREVGILGSFGDALCRIKNSKKQTALYYVKQKLGR